MVLFEKYESNHAIMKKFGIKRVVSEMNLKFTKPKRQLEKALMVVYAESERPETEA